MTGKPSKTQLRLARLTMALMVGLVVFGVAAYGITGEVLARIWHNLLDRPSGPMTFRILLQPIMATIAASLDGLKDARTGRSPYLWTIITNPARRGDQINEGLIATARVLLLGLCMDLIYQYIVFDTFHPAEAVIVAILLAFVPYMLLRGPIARVGRWWRGGKSASDIR